MIIQPPAGLRAGPCSGLSGAGWRVALRLGEGVAVIGHGEANSDTDEDWARPLHHRLLSGQSG